MKRILVSLAVVMGLWASYVFAADTFQTGIDLMAGTPVQFFDNTDAHWVALKAPASVAANATYTLPSVAGSSGQALVTDGSGVLSWHTVGVPCTAAIDWTTADGATKTVVHNCGTRDMIVKVYDGSSGGDIEVSVVRVDANTLTVTAAEAPPSTPWRVLALAI